ncbi:MAG: hypothetical protein EBR79_00890 [Proteobacteria bacterium]|nr:hypothetical protein [Pseudomonadota bacterium]NBX86475.1 hypothetical protein [Pseudomonadota bacterium]
MLWGLFELEGLPTQLADFLKGFENDPLGPVAALNALPAFLKAKVGAGKVEGKVEDGAVLHGAVWVGAGSIVHSGAVVEGPVYIGKHVTIRPHANVRHGSYLADNCVIGHSADVKNILALEGAKIQDGTFAGDGILGRGARVGSGAILANRKFNQSAIKCDWGAGAVDSKRDFLGAFMGDQSRVGANVVASPGAVVGAHSWVGSGVVLNGYIAPDQLVTVKQELDVRPKERVSLKAGAAVTYSG